MCTLSVNKQYSDFKKLDSLSILYNAYVKSKLLYASQIWSPSTKKLSNEIEKIQHYFLSLSCEICVWAAGYWEQERKSVICLSGFSDYPIKG